MGASFCIYDFSTGNQSQPQGTGNQSQAQGTGNQSQAQGTGNKSQAQRTGNQSQAQGTGKRDRDDVEIVDMETCTTSTNISDDFAHRGDGLQSMPIYVYRM